MQFIHRWTFQDPFEVAVSFDFSIAAAAVWYDVDRKVWLSDCDEMFYPDLAAKRLRYLSPVRNEDAGGSFLRMAKFLRRGYKISPESLGKLMARLNQGIKYPDFLAKDEAWQAQVYTGLLREVDPLTIIDGVEAVEGNDGNFHQRADGDHGWVQIHDPNS